MFNPNKLICPVGSYEHVFEKFASELTDYGFCIDNECLGDLLAEQLYMQVNLSNSENFDSAGVGRRDDYDIVKTIRSDEIAWIYGETTAEKHWLAWIENLRVYLNKRLYLGLFSFESHFAKYKEGAHYRRHLDAFHGEANRVLSVVVYLNKDWQPKDGGEMVLYRNEKDTIGIKIAPTFGTVAVFLSEQFPHEVLPTQRERHSIAGWFRVNH
ncbi:2OG-Fe(II) oxygenase [Thalassotalea fusca]